jgi:hypothetical protein
MKRMTPTRRVFAANDEHIQECTALYTRKLMMANVKAYLMPVDVFPKVLHLLLKPYPSSFLKLDAEILAFLIGYHKTCRSSNTSALAPA